MKKIIFFAIIIIVNQNSFAGRLYDPEVGRWLNRDPIGNRGGINIYNSVSNNMVNGYSVTGAGVPLNYTNGMSLYVGFLEDVLGVDPIGLLNAKGAFNGGTTEFKGDENTDVYFTLDKQRYLPNLPTGNDVGFPSKWLAQQIKAGKSYNWHFHVGYEVDISSTFSKQGEVNDHYWKQKVQQTSNYTGAVQALKKFAQNYTFNWKDDPKGGGPYPSKINANSLLMNDFPGMEWDLYNKAPQSNTKGDITIFPYPPQNIIDAVRKANLQFMQGFSSKFEFETALICKKPNQPKRIIGTWKWSFDINFVIKNQKPEFVIKNEKATWVK